MKPDRIPVSELRRNAALLKLDLYCRGARLDESCYIEGDGGRKVLRTRAGLGSGLELILPGGLWTNVPVTEPFAARSPYVICRSDGDYFIRYDDEIVAPVRLSPRPGWYDGRTASGKPMTRIGTLQGTYLGIYQAKVCEYWTARPQKTSSSPISCASRRSWACSSASRRHRTGTSSDTTR